MNFVSSEAVDREGVPNLEIGKLPSLAALILPYLKSGEGMLSGAMALIIIVSGYVGVYFSVWRNAWTGEFYDAIGAEKYQQLSPLLMQFLALISVSSVMVILSSILQYVLELRWRTWLTNHFATGWMENRSFYRIERDKELDNADQRIAEDTKLFVSNTLTLFFDILRVPVTALTLSIVLWRLTGSYTLHWHEKSIVIPGYMVIAVYVFSGGSLLITHLLGRRLIRLNVLQQKREADFRVLMVQIRESAEQIAFYRGERTEIGRLRAMFESVRKNAMDIIVVQAKVQLSTNVYGQIASILPVLLVLPQLLAGQMNLGGLMRVSNAFGQVDSTLAFFPQVYQQFATWRSNTLRLKQLLAAQRESDVPGFRFKPSLDGSISVQGVTLKNPEHMLIAVVPPIRLMRGERCLIRGRSGAGKSTLLRAMAGLWPYGGGNVMMPDTDLAMFIPQRSYVPDGTLKQALAYPASPDDYADRACLDALATVGLDKYRDVLYLEERWRQRLSGGEQQRLGFARILLKRPSYVFLDEATSALDSRAEAILYQTIIDELPGMTLVSVAHRDAVAKYHNRVLDLSASEEDDRKVPNVLFQ